MTTVTTSPPTNDRFHAPVLIAAVVAVAVMLVVALALLVGNDSAPSVPARSGVATQPTVTTPLGSPDALERRALAEGAGSEAYRYGSPDAAERWATG